MIRNLDLQSRNDTFKNPDAFAYCISVGDTVRILHVDGKRQWIVVDFIKNDIIIAEIDNELVAFCANCVIDVLYIVTDTPVVAVETIEVVNKPEQPKAGTHKGDTPKEPVATEKKRVQVVAISKKHADALEKYSTKKDKIIYLAEQEYGPAVIARFLKMQSPNVSRTIREAGLRDSVPISDERRQAIKEAIVTKKVTKLTDDANALISEALSSK